MADDHCFISYSTADALEFARRLADELQGGEDTFIKTWFDKRDIDPARDWDDQIVEGIRDCKYMLFVMTKDSTSQGSMCKNEWNWALKYKKPVVPIRLQKEAEQPFGLGNRQWIDFTGEFEHGLSRLRLFLREMDSPKGSLQSLKDRHADAERDLRRAKPQDQPRIQADIDELNKQIESQQKIVDDPQAAKEQTQKNIEAGLERERQPEKPITGKASTKFINPPPGVAPSYFQDRSSETKEIVRFLHDDAQRMLTVVGRGGVGKTAMVCRLLKHLENGTLPDDLAKTFGETKVDGIVYLSESGSHRVNFANIFADLSKLLPTETANSLETIYKNPQVSSAAKMSALVDKFPSGKVVLLLDNIEPLINVETFSIGDAELDESLCAFLYGEHSALKIILTTRIAPRGLNLCEPGRQRVLPLDEGLESPYAENILREMDSDGKLRLKNAPAELLAHAREHTRGYPRALEALFAILASDRYTSLEEILATAENYLPDEVVEALVGEAFSRLDANAQKVMQALAIYNRPVTPAAIDYLLAPHLPSIDSAPVLNRLVNMQFVRRESGKYYLHPVDREYALSRIPTEEGETDWDQKSLTTNAADYFAQARKPREEWKKLDDLAAQLAEFDLRCAAGDYDTAAGVLTDIDFDYLLLWGHYRLTFGLYEKVYKNVNDKVLKESVIGNMGTTCFYTAQYQNALHYHGIALKIAEEEGSKTGQSVWINWIANSYRNLGRIQDSITQYELSLKLAKETSNRKNEGIALGNLGLAYADLGEAHKAIEFHEQALTIVREIGDRRGEGNALGNLGSAYADLGDTHKAIEFYEQHLAIAREIGDRRGESISLGNMGLALLSLENHQKASDVLLQSIKLADEISYPIAQNEARWDLAQVYLFQNDFVNARATIEAALQYDVPQFNHNASVLQGIITLRQENVNAANQAFKRAIAQADEILAKTPDYYDALDAKGLASCGLAICDDKKYVAEAIETFRAARKIAPHAGVVKRVLRLFDELVKCDEEGILKEVREAVGG
jgi:tetratricopeptide (TPR) repeat protein